MPQSSPSASLDIAYRTIAVEGVNIFYREAGPADGPVPFDHAVFANFLLDRAFFVGLPIALLVRRGRRVS